MMLDEAVEAIIKMVINYSENQITSEYFEHRLP